MKARLCLRYCLIDYLHSCTIPIQQHMVKISMSFGGIYHVLKFIFYPYRYQTQLKLLSLNHHSQPTKSARDLQILNALAFFCHDVTSIAQAFVCSYNTGGVVQMGTCSHSCFGLVKLFCIHSTLCMTVHKSPPPLGKLAMWGRSPTSTLASPFHHATTQSTTPPTILIRSVLEWTWPIVGEMVLGSKPVACSLKCSSDTTTPRRQSSSLIRVLRALFGLHQVLVSVTNHHIIVSSLGVSGWMLLALG